MNDTSGYEYWAFVSYNKHDKSTAQWLHRAIETYRIPAQLVNHPTPAGHLAPKRFQPSFRDREELSASADLGAEIEGALRASRFLIVVCSPWAAKSKWVNKEIETFQRLGRNDRILTFIVDGEPCIGGERECFPPALLHKNEPVAADARRQAEGKNNAKLKLLAGMLGVSFDALKQRDTHRRNQRLKIVLAISLLLTLAFAALSWYAIQQRTVAVERNVRLRRLLSGLLGPLSDHIDALPGSLKIKDEILDGIEQDLSQLMSEKQGDLGLDRELEVTYQKNGAVRLELGKLAESRSLYESGLAISQRLVQADASNAIYQQDLALNHEGIGVVCLRQGKLNDAEEHFGKSLGILSFLHKKLPDLKTVNRDLARLYRYMGILQSDRGDIDGAILKLNESIRVHEWLTGTDPQNASFIGEYAGTCQQYAHTLRIYGDTNEAHKMALYCITLAGRVVQGMPDHRPSKFILALGHLELAETCLARGDLISSLRYADKGLTELQVLHNVDRESVTLSINIAQATITQARIFKARKQIKAAVERYTEAINYCDRISQIDKTDITVLTTKASALGEMALMQRNGMIASPKSLEYEFADILKSIQAEGLRLDKQLQQLKRLILDKGPY